MQDIESRGCCKYTKSLLKILSCPTFHDEEWRVRPILSWIVNLFLTCLTTEFAIKVSAVNTTAQPVEEAFLKKRLLVLLDFISSIPFFWVWTLWSDTFLKPYFKLWFNTTGELLACDGQDFEHCRNHPVLFWINVCNTWLENHVSLYCFASSFSRSAAQESADQMMLEGFSQHHHHHHHFSQSTFQLLQSKFSKFQIQCVCVCQLEADVQRSGARVPRNTLHCVSDNGSVLWSDAVLQPLVAKQGSFCVRGREWLTHVC